MSLNLGGRIRTMRAERGLTLPQLADKAGLSKGLLSQLENSESPNPSLDTLNKIAKALEVTLSVLLEKRGVKARRFVPDQIAPELREFLAERREQGLETDEGVLQALYVLQERGGTGMRTQADWRWLYESIAMRLKGGGD